VERTPSSCHLCGQSWLVQGAAEDTLVWHCLTLNIESPCPWFWFYFIETGTLIFRIDWLIDWYLNRVFILMQITRHQKRARTLACCRMLKHFTWVLGTLKDVFYPMSSLPVAGMFLNSYIIWWSSFRLNFNSIVILIEIIMHRFKLACIIYNNGYQLLHSAVTFV